MKKLLIVCMLLMPFVLVTPSHADISLPGGTVTANRQDSSTGGSAWFGESVTTLAIDAHSKKSVADSKCFGFSAVRWLGAANKFRPGNLTSPTDSSRFF